MARTTQLRTVREMKPVVSFRFVSHASSLAIGFIGYCESEKTREVYVCMTLQICQRARRRVGGRIGEDEISHCACTACGEISLVCVSREDMLMMGETRKITL